MIARSWRGETRKETAAAYVRHLEENVLPELRAIEGHRGAYVLKRPKGEGLELVVLTLWDSLEAVKAFAGPSPERAVVPPEARALLSRFDERVEHFEVVLSPAASGQRR